MLGHLPHFRIVRLLDDLAGLVQLIDHVLICAVGGRYLGQMGMLLHELLVTSCVFEYVGVRNKLFYFGESLRQLLEFGQYGVVQHVACISLNLAATRTKKAEEASAHTADNVSEL